MEALTAGLIVGIIIGWVAADLLLAQPARAERNALRHLNERRLRNDLVANLERIEWRAAHVGTPYRPETVAAASPGLRAVGDETMYSAGWLDDQRGHA